MGKWNTMYQNLTNSGLDVYQQLANTAWMDCFIPQFNYTEGKMLDLGFGLGPEMLRCAILGYEPYGLDLEAHAVEFVRSTYGFSVQQHDLNEPLPFDDCTFSLVVSKLTLHYLDRKQAQTLYQEINRALKPQGQLLFMVNSEIHRQLGLQYNYAGAVQVEPQRWYLPNDMARTFLFYTPKLARELLGEGWQWQHLDDEQLEHWDIDKRVIIGLATKERKL